MVHQSVGLKAATTTRRQRLMDRLAGCSGLICSGSSIGRTYLGNPYPFRASSHFLYFVGYHLPDAFLLFDSGGPCLFLEPQTADDIVWHGPKPSLSTLEAELGLPVRPVSELSAARLKDVMTLPGIHEQTRTLQASMLGRSIKHGIEAYDRPLAMAVIELRLSADAHAVRCLSASADLAARAHALVPELIEPGMSEQKVWSEMQRLFTAEGYEAAYNPIITRAGEVLHGRVTSDVLEDGDLLLLDVGCEHPEGWAADISRTWPVSGTLSSTQSEIYQAVLTAQSSAIEKCRMGQEYRSVHETAARSLTASLVELGILNGCVDTLFQDHIFAYFFPHGIGHLLGLDVHDMEDLGDLAGYESGRVRDPSRGFRYLRLNRPLLENMVVTIEPGFYQIPALLEEARVQCPDRINWSVLEKFSDVRGIRIEDDVLVTNAEPLVLSARAQK